MSNDVSNLIVSDLNMAMNTIIAATKKEIDKLETHEKIILKDLTDKVVKETGIKAYKATGIINAYLDSNESGVTVRRGAGGGVFKGGEKLRQDFRKRCESCNQVIRDFGNKSCV
jgi:hypothetical protein